MNDLLPCPFCGGPAVNVACEYVTCGLAEPMGERCIGKSVRAPVDDDDCALSKVWNNRANWAAPVALPSREVIAREIRLAMLDSPTDESFNKRAEKREAIANDAADTILKHIKARAAISGASS